MEKHFQSALFALFVASAAKLLIVSASWEGVVLSIVIGGLYALSRYVENKEQLDILRKDLSEQNQRFMQLHQDLAEFRTFVATSKMSNQLRR